MQRGSHRRATGDAPARVLIEPLEPRQMLAAQPLFNVVKHGPVRPVGLTTIGASLFFFADTDTGFSNSLLSNRQLWKTDGTLAGTVRLTTNLPQTRHEPVPLTAVLDGKLYFIHARALWQSDGTVAGTRQVSPQFSADPRELVATANAVYFDGSNDAHGNELRCYDDVNGFRLVRNIAGGARSAGPADLTAAGSTLYFAAADTAHGREIWKSDGTAAGTVMVADLTPGKGGSSPAGLAAAADGRIFFGARTPQPLGGELWITDGTAAGTRALTDLTPLDNRVEALAELNGRMLFREIPATGDNSGVLWSTDGTPNGIVRIGLISGSSITLHQGRAYYPATPDQGNDFFSTDGVTAGASVSDELPATGQAFSIGERLLFPVTDRTAFDGGAIAQADANGNSFRLPGTEYDFGVAREAAAIGNNLFVATEHYDFETGVRSGNLFVTDVSGGSISGIVFGDTNRNGFLDGFEQSVAGDTVFLDGNDNGLPDPGEPAQVLTNEAPFYRFSRLKSRTYRVRVLPPPGRVLTTSDAYSVRIVDGRSLRRDFGIDGGRISGSVFRDNNANGARDADEPAMPGQALFLDYNGDTVFDAATEPHVTSSKTGRYTFSDVAAGKYAIRAVPVTGFDISTPQPLRVTLAAGATVTRNVGYSPGLRGNITAIVLSDDRPVAGQRIFMDLNRDYQFQSDEPLRITSKTGRAWFTDLIPGTYWIGRVEFDSWTNTDVVTIVRKIPVVGGATAVRYF